MKRWSRDYYSPGAEPSRIVAYARQIEAAIPEYHSGSRPTELSGLERTQQQCLK